MPGLSEEDKISLRETWIDAHLANSVEVTFEVWSSTGADDTYGTPTGVAYADHVVHAQLFAGDNRRVRGLFGDDVVYAWVAELSKRELMDVGVTPKETDRLEYNGRLFTVAAIREFEQIGEELMGIALALRYEGDA